MTGALLVAPRVDAKERGAAALLKAERDIFRQPVCEAGVALGESEVCAQVRFARDKSFRRTGAVATQGGHVVEHAFASFENPLAVLNTGLAVPLLIFDITGEDESSGKKRHETAHGGAR